MALSFNDLDPDLQRSVFSAFSIVGLLLCLALVQIIHYILIGLCVLIVGYFSWMLFVDPRIKKNKQGRGKK